MCRDRLALIIVDIARLFVKAIEQSVGRNGLVEMGFGSVANCELWLGFTKHRKQLPNFCCRPTFKPLAEFDSSLRNYLKLLAKTF